MDRLVPGTVLAFASGVAAARGLPSPWVAPALLGSAALCLAAGRAPGLRRRLPPPFDARVPPLLLALAVAAGAARASFEALPPSPRDLAVLLPRGAAPVLLEGVVTDAARRIVRPGRDPGAPAREVRIFPVEARALFGPGGPVEARGVAEVSAEDAGSAPRPGDRVRVLGTARAPPTLRNPGGRDSVDEARARGIARFVDAAGPGAVRVVEEGPAFDGAGIAADLRAGLLDAVDRAYDGRGRALYAALLAGDPSGLDPRSVEAWRRTGTWHVLVVSGYHVAAAAAAAAWILGRAGAGPRTRALGAAGTAAAYAAATGFGTPALRALVAVALVALAPLLRRRAEPFHALCVAAGVLLAHRPAVLSEPGFQLSFAAVLGLLRLSPAVGTLLFARRRFLRRFPVPAADRSLRRRLGDALERGLPAALGAWAATAPILVHHFGTLSPVTPLANLLLVPLSTALLGVGAALLPLGPVVPAIPHAAGEAAAALLDALVRGLERLPGAWYAIPPPPAALLAADAIALAAAALSPTPARLLAAAAALAALGSLPLAAPPGPPAPSCLVLDVGHGLAVLADGGAARVLGDAGGRGPRAGERSVLPALRARGALCLDALLISHEDLDHLSAAREVLESARVGALVVPEGFGAAPCASEVLASAAREGVPVIRAAAGDRLRLPGLVVEILHPPRGRGPAPAENGGSLVARVRMDGLTALLPGDIEGEPLQSLLRSGADLRADILLLPHHGSPSAGDLATLAAATGARYLVASSGSATTRVDRVPSPTAPRFLATDEEGAILIGARGIEEWR